MNITHYTPLADLTYLAGPDTLIMLVAGFILWMLIDCIAFQPGIAAKLGWGLLIICFPPLGALIYMLTARRKRRRAKPLQ